MERYPLSGLTVTALEQAVAAPLCTRHLADLGAEVIKIEPVGTGDFARHYDHTVEGSSAYFVWLNRNKLSVTLNLKTSEGGSILNGLLDRTDVFVHNLGPGVIDRLGLGAAALAKRFPRLITAGITGYGETGPYADRKAYDALIQGEVGLPWINGTQRERAKVAISIADIAGGMYALAAVLAAIIQRQGTGVGTRIDISLLESLSEWMMAPACVAQYTGSAPLRSGLRHTMIVPYGPVTSSNNVEVNIAIQNAGEWQRFCTIVLTDPTIAEDPRFSTNESRVRNRESLDPVITAICGELTDDELRDRLARADIPYGNLNDVRGLLDHKQLEARQRWGSVDSEVGPIKALLPSNES